MGSQIDDKQLLEEKYQKAIAAYKEKKAGLDSLYDMFEEVGDYKNAPKYLDAIAKEKEYRKLVNEFKSGNCNWIKISDGFKALEGYKKSEEYYSECQAKAEGQRKNQQIINENKKNAEKSAKYKKAIESMRIGSYERASSLFGEVGDYLDAKEKRRECLKRVDERRRAEEEEASRKRRRTTIIVIAAIIAFIIICAYGC